MLKFRVSEIFQIFLQSLFWFLTSWQKNPTWLSKNVNKCTDCKWSSAVLLSDNRRTGTVQSVQTAEGALSRTGRARCSAESKKIISIWWLSLIEWNVIIWWLGTINYLEKGTDYFLLSLARRGLVREGLSTRSLRLSTVAAHLRAAALI